MSTTYYPRDDYECTDATYTERRTKDRAETASRHRLENDLFGDDVDLTTHRYIIIELTENGDRAWSYGYETLDDVRSALSDAWWYAMQPGYVLDLDTGSEYEIQRSFRLDDDEVTA